tara:strand:+ start:665 stop:2464 length:1800 start_codon:yes stop_codon:yes gene_type:complete
MGYKFALMTAVVSIALAGCTTPTGEYSNTTNRHSEQLAAWQQQMDKVRDARVRVTNVPSVGERIQLQRHSWLKEKRITLAISKGATGVTAHTLAQMLRDEGIQVMSTMPLEGYKYNGFGVNNVDGVSAMRILFGPMGLDYEVSDDGQYVVIMPNRSRTFFVKLGERVTEYKSGTMTGNIGTEGSSGGNTGSGGMDSGSDSGSLGVSTGLDTGTGQISIQGDFWSNLKEELSSMMTQCIPDTVAPSSIPTMANLPGLASIQGMPGSGAGGGVFGQQLGQIPRIRDESSTYCTEQVMGTATVNPSTGAITIQAPHWISESIAKYLEGVKADNAVTLVYEGMLIAVTSKKDKQEGIDLQGFASFAGGELGMVVTNNALGGVTVSGGTAVPGGDVIAGSMIGLQKLTGNPAQAFLAYLEANSEFSIMQRPLVAVTNGVPGEFGQYDTLFYNRINQETSTGGDGAVVGTQNELIPFKVGNLLRIVPYYDSETGVVRSPITFSQSVRTGTYESTQFLTGADGQIQNIPSDIPLIRDSNYSGEVLMRDGDMMIIGGQISESADSSGSGIPGYNTRNNPLSALMGQKTHSDSRSTYYLALTLKVRNQ